jgi:hypothetical protein
MSTIPNLKDLIVGNQRVRFHHYQSRELWYKHETTGFKFPVPIEDTGDGIFEPIDKASFFMRWIRRHIELLTRAQTETIYK